MKLPADSRDKPRAECLGLTAREFGSDSPQKRITHRWLDRPRQIENDVELGVAEAEQCGPSTWGVGAVGFQRNLKDQSDLGPVSCGPLFFVPLGSTGRLDLAPVDRCLERRGHHLVSRWRAS